MSAVDCLEQATERESDGRNPDPNMPPQNPLKSDLPSLSALVESLLFVADEPVTAKRLGEALEADESEVKVALATLEAACAGRGLRLQHIRGRVQLTTAPQAAPHIERFMGLEMRSRLSTAALETLAIIA